MAVWYREQNQSSSLRKERWRKAVPRSGPLGLRVDRLEDWKLKIQIRILRNEKKGKRRKGAWQPLRYCLRTSKSLHIIKYRDHRDYIEYPVHRYVDAAIGDTSSYLIVLYSNGNILPA